MDNNHNLVRCSNHTVKKIYSSKERFDCELKYLRLFRDQGFSTPKIISKDEHKLEIVLSRVQGYTSLSLTDKEIMTCIRQLAKIYMLWSFENDLEKISRQYIEKMKFGLEEFCQAHALTISQEVLESYLQALHENFDASLFKDAKPSNWVFDGSKACLIDFDYVKPSFYLADIAQLLNYQQLSYETKCGYVDSFMKLIDKEKYGNYLLFDLASIHSRIMAMRYNINLDKRYRDRFTQLLKYDLERIKLT